MKRLNAIAAGLVLAAMTGCAYMPGSMGGWTTLVDDGKYDSFNKVGNANWRVVDGAVVADKGSGFLVTKADYADFELRAEFYAEADTNSGIFLRCGDREKLTATVCYEVNIWDMRPAPEYGTGAIVDIAKVVPMPKAGGRWNTYEIMAKGDHLVVTFNGVKTVDVHDAKHARGPIGLQYAPGVNKEVGRPIKWRKVQIRPL
jgi:3-keto-disaccharide hydrolase